MTSVGLRHGPDECNKAFGIGQFDHTNEASCYWGKPRGRRISLGEYKRAVSWSKYLVSPGAAIKGEGEEEWSADMSQLFIGSKFAYGRHSRIYRGEL
ncbi:unnamed protein product [Lupinus luteus]|uniref:Uncharacterized protein n=1 Tax=Lupinus luteus TaxID=3873 RepID=A0AAV1XQ84_LUPLU